MLPEAPVPAKRKQALLVAGAMTSCGIAVWALLTGPPLHVSTVLAAACVVLGIAAVVYVGWPDSDGFLIRLHGRRKSGGRDGGPAGRGRSGIPGTAPAPAGRPVLRAVARLMPPAAGRRWLAEANSLLFELALGQRRQAVRSYLRSAPALIVAMWAGQLSRRARSRRRRGLPDRERD